MAAHNASAACGTISPLNASSASGLTTNTSPATTPASVDPRSVPNVANAAPQATRERTQSPALTVGTHSGFGSDRSASTRA